MPMSIGTADHRVQLSYDDLDPREARFPRNGARHALSLPRRASQAWPETRAADLERTGRTSPAWTTRWSRSRGASTWPSRIRRRCGPTSPTSCGCASQSSCCSSTSSRSAVSATNERMPRTPRLDIELIEDGEGRELTFVKLGRHQRLHHPTPPRSYPTRILAVHVKYTNSNAIYKLNPFYSYRQPRRLASVREVRRHDRRVRPELYRSQALQQSWASATWLPANREPRQSKRGSLPPAACSSRRSSSASTQTIDRRSR